MPVGSTTVTVAFRPSSLCSRFAASVPPTPPPRTTIRAGIGSPSLADDEPGEAVLRSDLDHLVAGLGDPGRDVGLRSLVARQDLDDVAHGALADRADQGHQRAGAGHASRVDRSADGDLAHGGLSLLLVLL